MRSSLEVWLGQLYRAQRAVALLVRGAPPSLAVAAVAETPYRTPGVLAPVARSFDALRVLAFCADPLDGKLPAGAPVVMLGDHVTMHMEPLRGARRVWVWTAPAGRDVTVGQWTSLGVVAPFAGMLIQHELLVSDRDEYLARVPIGGEAGFGLAIQPERDIRVPAAVTASGDLGGRVSLAAGDLRRGPTVVRPPDGQWAWADAVTWTDDTPLPFDVAAFGGVHTTVTENVRRCMRGGALGTYANGVYHLPIGQLLLDGGSGPDDGVLVMSRWPARAHVVWAAALPQPAPSPRHPLAALWHEPRFTGGGGGGTTPLRSVALFL